jgi:hypothetical protein
MLMSLFALARLLTDAVLDQGTGIDDALYRLYTAGTNQKLAFNTKSNPVILSNVVS